MNKNIKILSVQGICLALAIITSTYIKIFHMPLGGSVSLCSMLFVALPSYFFGVKIGLISSFAFSILTFVIDPLFYYPMQFIFDYILAFTSLGLTGIFREKKYGLQIGFSIAVFFRFLFTSISGYLFFREYVPIGWNPIFYTVIYNGSYMSIELLFTLIIIGIPPIQKILITMKQKFNQ
ncbi:MAG: energy-coupled thiamine transporter ThiT [Eubacteriales bacterium]|nr:energy-coupled thiamine transporter ThiT [Eubacteriales bacterium]